jgi:adenylate kinase
MASGQLVPDEVVNQIVNSRFRSKDRPTDFVMDGYPRTLAQALSFENVLKEQALPLDAVILLHVDDDEIVRRLSGRLTCINPGCGAVYHPVSSPPKVSDRCDRCNHLLYQREDDKPETVRRRLQIFHAQYDGIVNHYRKQGLVVEVPGRGDIEAIYAAIVQALNQKMAAKKSGRSPG